MPVVRNFRALLRNPDAADYSAGLPGKTGAPVIITYSFADTGRALRDFEANIGASGQFSAFTKAQQRSFRQAADAYEAESAVIFVEVANDGMIDVANGQNTGYRGLAGAPLTFGGETQDGILMIDGVGGDYGPGSRDFRLMLHELGHIVGFDHLDEGPNTLPAHLDVLSQSVMSKAMTDGVTRTNELGVMDKQALALLYGPASATRGWDVTATQKGVRITASNRDDKILSPASDTFAYGLGGDDRMTGREEDDNFFGGAGADRLLGFLGNDRLFGGNGTDVILGHDGRDDLRGGGGDDVLAGGEGQDKLAGGGGSDRLDGGAAHDTLAGGAGGDDLIGGSGRDVLNGGGGHDDLSGGRDNDQLFGGAQNDLVQGGAGHDRLDGGKGRDVLRGDAGDDELSGGDAQDQLFGGAGADSLDGGAGRDQMYGGSGADSFVFRAGDDTVHDLDVARDQLLLDQGLWTDDLDAAQVVSTYGALTGGGARLTFETGDTVHVLGISDLDALAAVVSFV